VEYVESVREKSSFALAALVVMLSVPVVRNILSPNQVAPPPLRPCARSPCARSPCARSLGPAGRRGRSTCFTHPPELSRSVLDCGMVCDPWQGRQQYFPK